MKLRLLSLFVLLLMIFDGSAIVPQVDSDKKRAEPVVGGQSVEAVLARDTPRQKWRGLDVDGYRNMDFVRPGGRMYITGHVDNYTPKLGFSTVTFTTRNEITGKDTQTITEVDSSGNFAVDVPVDYPQFGNMRFGDFFETIFFCPDDTLAVYTTTVSVNRNVKYLNCMSAQGDAADITLLNRHVHARLGLPSASYRELLHAVSLGRDSVMALGRRLKSRVGEIARVAPAVIDSLDVSPFAKDILLTSVMVEAFMPLEEMLMSYRDGCFIRTADNELASNPDFEEIALADYYDDIEEYASILFDNPLVMCCGWVFINRTEFNGLFRHIGHIATGNVTINMDNGAWQVDSLTVFEGNESRYDRVMAISKDRSDAVGVGNGFISQLIVAKNLTRSMLECDSIDDSVLGHWSDLCGDMLRLINHKALAVQVVETYGNLAKEIARRENISSPDPTLMVETRSRLLASIVEPFKGNVVYVDVWGFGCGPCKAGMLGHREVISHYAGSPLTVIYIAEESEKARCEKWMRDNDIKGEHVYLSQYDYRRLMADFDITAIPYAILIDKKGNIIDTRRPSFYISAPELEKLLAD